MYCPLKVAARHQCTDMQGKDFRSGWVGGPPRRRAYGSRRVQGRACGILVLPRRYFDDNSCVCAHSKCPRCPAGISGNILIALVRMVLTKVSNGLIVSSSHHGPLCSPHLLVLTTTTTSERCQRNPGFSSETALHPRTKSVSQVLLKRQSRPSVSGKVKS